MKESRSSKTRQVRRPVLVFFGLPLLGLLSSLLLIEGVLRIARDDHPRRKETVFGTELKPYAQGKFLLTAEEEETQSYLCRDPDLGWTIKPRAEAVNRPYTSNAHGLRSSRVDESIDGEIRIAAFGDSFTHCDEVAFEDSWTYLLEQNLPDHVRVLNGGVCGYGADQAWLRYQKLKHVIQPRIVILGLAMTAFKRNVNIFRMLVGEWTSWTKPRYVFEGHGFRWVNKPTMTAQDALHALETEAPITRFEFFYDRRDWTWTIWDESVLVRFLVGRFQKPRGRDSLYAKGAEPHEITWAIVRGFRREVESDGALFLCLIINDRPHLTGKGAKRWGPLVDRLREHGIEFVNPSPRLHALKDRDDLLAPGGHYSRLGNRVIARLVAKKLKPWLTP